MAYDEVLADRLREALAAEAAVSEMTMFGGLAFLIGGHMAVAASGQGGLLVRVDPATSDSLVASTNAYPMEMSGRPIRGWLRVDTDDVRTKRQLAKWVELGTTYALPPIAAAFHVPAVTSGVSGRRAACSAVIPPPTPLQRRLLPPQHHEVKRGRELPTRVLARLFRGGDCNTRGPTPATSKPMTSPNHIHRG